MAGLLDGYGIDLDEIEAPSFDIQDNIYEFEVQDFFLQEGTKADPEKNNLVIDYDLGDGKSKWEFFGLPKDMGDPTDKELQALGFYKNRLKDLGIAPEDMNGVSPDDLIGKRGTLQVFTNKGYQNIKNVKLFEEGSDEGLAEFAAKEGPGNKARTFVEDDEPAAPAQRRTRKPAAAKATEPEPEAAEDDEEQGEETEAPAEKVATRRPATHTQQGATQKARSAGVRENPFK
jgi:hypothetical protein